MTLSKTLSGLAFAALSTTANAAVGWSPQSGSWFNLAAPGREYSIEVQDNTMTLVMSGYRADGTASWYKGSGKLVEKSGKLATTATLAEYKDGQCAGCAYSKPVVANANAGKITLSFVDAGTAAVVFGTEKFTLKRTNAAIGLPPQALLGTWQMITEISKSVFADKYKLTEILPASSVGVTNGSRGMAAGWDNTGKDIVGAECYTKGTLAGQCIMVEIDGVTEDLENTFVFKQTVNQIYGSWISDTNHLYPMLGWRTLGKTATATGASAAQAQMQQEPTEGNSKKEQARQSLPQGARPQQDEALMDMARSLAQELSLRNLAN